MGTYARKKDERRRLESATWQMRALRQALAAADAVIPKHDPALRYGEDEDGGAEDAAGEREQSSAEPLRASRVRIRLSST